MKVCPTCGKQYPDDANFCPVDAGQLVPAKEQSRPARASSTVGGSSTAGGLIGNRFQLGESIGGGLTGEVFRATDTTTKAACVVKMVDASVFPSSLLMQRTERELKQLGRISDPGIVKVLAHGRDGSSLWIASELCDGTSLHDLIIDEGPMEPKRASQVVCAVGQALGAAAKVGVIHRDLAPKNLLMTRDGTVKIINFGVAAPAVNRVAGVPEFVAPEMIEGKAVDQRANIYSLGAIYYYLLTGRPPFVGAPEDVHKQHLTAEAEPPSELVPDLPETVDMVVLKALERHSRKRFMTLKQLLNVVEQLAAGNFELDSPSASVSQSLPSASGKGKDRKRALSSTMLGFGTSQSLRTVSDEEAAKAAAERAAAAGGAEETPAVAAAAEQPAPSPATTQPMGSAAKPAVAPGGGDVAVMERPVAEAPVQPAVSEAPVEEAPVEEAPVELVPKVPSGPKPALIIPDVAPAAAPAPVMAAEAQAPAPVMAAEAQAPVVPAPAQPSRQPRAATAPAGKKSGSSAALTGDEHREAIDKAKKRRDKNKFRETLWFKKGEMDAQAAEQAARQRADAAAPDKADLMPIEDRYEDDGTVTRADHDKFSLKTGSTQTMAAFRDKPAPASDVSDEELINEMKGGRGKIILLIAIGLVIVIGVVVFAFTGGHGGKSESEETQKPKIELPPEEPPTPGAATPAEGAATPTEGAATPTEGAATPTEGAASP